MSIVDSSTGRWKAVALWLPGLFVALGAGAATAHGAFETAAASGVPAGLAWVYPVITDGLALVAYVSTVQLVGHARGYAWAVVVLAAGLSGLAQASYLAGGVGNASAALRFGVGAWPAIAAAIVAHLLFLLATHQRGVDTASSHGVQEARRATVQREPVQPVVQPAVHAPVEHPEEPPAVEVDTAPVEQLTPTAGPAVNGQSASTPARDRARTAARRYASLHGSLPTVSQLQELTGVARGTAGNALKELRDQPTQLHVVNDSTTTQD